MQEQQQSQHCFHRPGFIPYDVIGSMPSRRPTSGASFTSARVHDPIMRNIYVNLYQKRRGQRKSDAEATEGVEARQEESSLGDAFIGVRGLYERPFSADMARRRKSTTHYITDVMDASRPTAASSYTTTRRFHFHLSNNQMKNNYCAADCVNHLRPSSAAMCTKPTKACRGATTARNVRHKRFGLGSLSRTQQSSECDREPQRLMVKTRLSSRRSCSNGTPVAKHEAPEDQDYFVCNEAEERENVKGLNEWDPFASFRAPSAMIVAACGQSSLSPNQDTEVFRNVKSFRYEPTTGTLWMQPPRRIIQ